jgi:hypothetical protein
VSSQGSSHGSSPGGWLDEPTNEAEAALAAALEEARGRVPDEVTLRRLWSKVASPEVERPARSRWPWFVGGVVTSSALAVALGIWLFPVRQQTRIIVGPMALTEVVAKSSVTVPAVPPALQNGQSGQDEAQADAQDSPGAPDVGAPVAVRVSSAKKPTFLRTSAGQTRRFVLRGGAEVRLSPSTIMTVASRAGGNDRPSIEKGDVAFSVPHQAPGHNFSVTAGPYRIVVVGTKFRLHVEGSTVAVAVDEGVVEVWKKHRLARLTPGDSWASPSERGTITSIDVAGSGPLQPQVAGPATPPVAPVAVPAAAVTAPVPAAPALAPPAAAVPVDQTQEARAALAAGDPRRALELYRAVIARGGPASENAGYEVGRILRDRLREPSDALTAWKRYRTLHPDGLLRVETDVSIIETLVASGDTTGALGEANDFLKRHADSERRAEIARITGDLYRERGECGHAVDAYETALAAARTREITEYASFHRAACLVSLGESSGNVALEEYLHTWPRGRFNGDAHRLLQAISAHTKTP